MENADLIKVGKQLVSLIKYAYFGGDEPLVDDYKSALKLSLKHSVVKTKIFNAHLIFAIAYRRVYVKKV